jgi:hypothetical protein
MLNNWTKMILLAVLIRVILSSYVDYRNKLWCTKPSSENNNDFLNLAESSNAQSIALDTVNEYLTTTESLDYNLKSKNFNKITDY